MAKDVTYQYCWLKVTELPQDRKAEKAGGDNAEVERNHLSLWTTPKTIVPLATTTFGMASPPLPGDPEPWEPGGVPCPGCNRGNTRTAGFTKSAMRLDSFVNGDSPHGWQLEHSTQGGDIAKMSIDLKPMGVDREAALSWMASDEGQAWAKDASAVTLMSSVSVTGSPAAPAPAEGG